MYAIFLLSAALDGSVGKLDTAVSVTFAILIYVPCICIILYNNHQSTIRITRRHDSVEAVRSVIIYKLIVIMHLFVILQNKKDSVISANQNNTVLHIFTEEGLKTY
jgi:chorismate synthase